MWSERSAQSIKSEVNRRMRVANRFMWSDDFRGALGVLNTAQGETLPDKSFQDLRGQLLCITGNVVSAHRAFLVTAEAKSQAVLNRRYRALEECEERNWPLSEMTLFAICKDEGGFNAANLSDLAQLYAQRARSAPPNSVFRELTLVCQREACELVDYHGVPYAVFQTYQRDIKPKAETRELDALKQRMVERRVNGLYVRQS